MMPTNELGKSGIAVPVLGFGSAPVAGLDPSAGDAPALEVIRAAFDQGIFLFDTAPVYGAGRAETLVGRALQGVARSRYLISTKVGRVLDADQGGAGYDYSRDGVLRSLEGSLQRLQTDRVDILHIHDPDNHLQEALDHALPALADLRDQGVIRAIGAGMNQWQALEQFARAGGFDCFLLAGRYTLLEQGSLGFLDLCQEKGIGVLLGGVFNTGILATGAVAGARHNYREPSAEVMARAAALEAACAAYGVPLHAAAIHFAQAHPAVASLVLGMARPVEVDQNCAALQTVIPAALWADLRARGAIDPAAPLPG